MSTLHTVQAVVVYAKILHWTVHQYIDTVFSHIVSSETNLFECGNPKVTVHKAKGHST